MEQVIDEFINYIKDEKAASENTTLSYRRDLKKLCVYMEAQGDTSVDRMTSTNLTSFVLYLEKNGFSPATISRTIASVKSFVTYCMRKGSLEEDIAFHLKAPRIEKKKRESLSAEEVFQLLEQPDDTTTKGMRDKAMLELLYSTGMRVTELISLKIDDVNLKLGYVKCQDRTIQISRDAQIAVAKYITEARDSFLKTNENSLLFFNCTGGDMSRQGFWKMLKSYVKQAGIVSEITPHIIRNSLK